MSIIAIDFDGTIVEHKYPAIGEPVPLALETMKELKNNNHELILWTIRSGDRLQDAVEYLTENGIELYGININPDQSSWSNSPKAYAHTFIDDAALGCPLIHSLGSRPYVDWNEVRNLLMEQGFIVCE